MVRNSVAFISLVIALSSPCFAQGKWELKRNENGIEVYTRKPASGNLKELRVICDFNCTKEKFIKTLQDINNYKTWVYSTKANKILKVVNAQDIIYYSVSHLPWPLQDRDLIVELTEIPTHSADQFEIQVRGHPDYLPIDKDYVRVPYSLATWRVTIAGEKKLKIDYTFSVDPGGSVPQWLVNATMPIGPYNSFLKLQGILSKTD